MLRDSESAGVYAGFLAGVIGSHPGDADRIIAEVLSVLPAEDQWIVVRAIAYSGLPDWKALMSKFAPRMPSRSVMTRSNARAARSASAVSPSFGFPS